MFGVRTLRIRSSLLASAAAVVTVATALAAGTGSNAPLAVKGDRLPMPVKVSCETPDCANPGPAYRTEAAHDREAGVSTLTRIPLTITPVSD